MKKKHLPGISMLTCLLLLISSLTGETKPSYGRIQNIINCGNANITERKLNHSRYSFTLDSKGYPHVVWLNGDPISYEDHYAVRYIKWNGEKWVCFDGSDFKPEVSLDNDGSIVNNIYKSWVYCVDIALDSSDEPHLVWAEPRYNDEESKWFSVIIHVRLDGGKWVSVDGSSFNPNCKDTDDSCIASIKNLDSIEPVIKIDSKDRPHVSYRSYGDFEADNQYFPVALMYSKWNGKDWAAVNGKKPKSANLVPDNPAVVCTELYSTPPVGRHDFVLDRKNNPHITWENGVMLKECKDDLCFYTFHPDIFYAKWDGKKWVDADGIKYDKKSKERCNISKSKASSQSPKLVLDSKGNPHLTWDENTSNTNSVIVYVKWNGKKWVTNFGEKFRSGLLFSGSSAVISKTQHSIRPNISLDSRDKPVVSWIGTSDYDTDPWDIYLVRWNGKKWVEMNSNPYVKNDENPDPANVTKSDYLQYRSQMEIDSNGNPHILWCEGELSFLEYVGFGTYGNLNHINWNGENWVNTQGEEYDPAKLSE